MRIRIAGGTQTHAKQSQQAGRLYRLFHRTAEHYPRNRIKYPRIPRRRMHCVGKLIISVILKLIDITRTANTTAVMSLLIRLNHTNRPSANIERPRTVKSW